MTETQEASTSSATSPRTKFVFIAVAVAIAALVGYKWWWNLGHVSTDNAQIEGHIVTVMPKVGGFVAEVNVVDHQMVKAGDQLSRIDDRDYRVRLNQAEAELQLAIANAGQQGQSGQASAQLAAARASAAAARSTVEQALANADRAQKDLARIRGLVETKMVSQQQLDAAESTARAALAQLQASRQSATSAGEQVSATNAALRAALANVDAARAKRDLIAQQLADTRIVAPASGIASNKNMEPGQLVQVGHPLLTVVPLDEIWVIANLKETDIHSVQAGDRTKIVADAYPGLKLEGQVASISPATGARFTLLPPDNATGNFTKVVQRIPVKIQLKQNDDQKRPLRPGMSVSIIIDTR